METGGFFNIRRSDSRVALKLKGNFDTGNICWINQVLMNRKFFHSKFLEIDMSEAGNINERARALLACTLRKLREKGIIVTVTQQVDD